MTTIDGTAPAAASTGAITHPPRLARPVGRGRRAGSAAPGGLVGCRQGRHRQARLRRCRRPHRDRFLFRRRTQRVRGHDRATAFLSMLALAASLDRVLAADYGVALARETWPRGVTRSSPRAWTSPGSRGAAGRGSNWARIPFWSARSAGSPVKPCRAKGCWPLRPTTWPTTSNGFGPGLAACPAGPRRSTCTSTTGPCTGSTSSRSVVRY